MSGVERQLTDVRTHGRGSKRRSLVLDGEPWLSLPLEVLRELGIRQGDLVDADALEQQIASCAPRVARERALRLLSVRERTVSELVGRLIDDGYSVEIATCTVERLVETGLVDDERFAEAMARVLIGSRRLGRGRALRELIRKGVDEELAARSLDEYAAVEGEGERTREMARRLSKPGDTVNRLASRLVRRGFAAGDALAAARELVESEGQDDVFFQD